MGVELALAVTTRCDGVSESDGDAVGDGVDAALELDVGVTVGDSVDAALELDVGVAQGDGVGLGLSSIIVRIMLLPESATNTVPADDTATPWG